MQLAREARMIYDTYLSISAFNAINIDDTARMEESELRDPKTDMFAKPQQQVLEWSGPLWQRLLPSCKKTFLLKSLVYLRHEEVDIKIHKSARQITISGGIGGRWGQ